MDKTIWILINPDNENWDEYFAREEIERLAEKWDIEISPTGKTRDQGAGQEEEFLLQGDEENVLFFEEELDEILS